MMSRRTRLGPRAVTIAPKRLRKEEHDAMLKRLASGGDHNAGRPQLRADCWGGERPCPWVSCRHHLYLDVTEVGSLKLNFPDLAPWELAETCALDVADQGGVTLERTGELLNLTRERVRQVEVRGLLKMQVAGAEIPEPAGDD